MFSEQVAWVTGASSGIGKAIATALHQNGAKVILSALDENELAPVADSLPGSAAIPFDVSDFEALPDIVAQAIAFHGRIDLLVNNAGVSQRAAARDTSLAVYRKIIDIDLVGPIALSQLVVPQMAARGQGRIIAISSIAGKFGFPMRTGYCAAKHGVFGYFDALRSEVAQDGIEVHVVAPGAVRTNLSVNAYTGGGQTYGRPDPALEAGYEPDWLAAEILTAVQQGKREIIIATGVEGEALALRVKDPDQAFDMLAELAPSIMSSFS